MLDPFGPDGGEPRIADYLRILQRRRTLILAIAAVLTAGFTLALLLRTPQHAGLLLPQVPVEWGWDVGEFLTQLCRKAGLPDGAYRRPDAELLAFGADVFGEEDDDG